jgi:hypothetical protein
MTTFGNTHRALALTAALGLGFGCDSADETATDAGAGGEQAGGAQAGGAQAGGAQAGGEQAGGAQAGGEQAGGAQAGGAQAGGAQAGGAQAGGGFDGEACVGEPVTPKTAADVPQEDAPTAYADRLCPVVAGCACGPLTENADEAACRANVEQFFGELQAFAAPRGLVYQPQCVGAFADTLADLGCAVNPESTLDLCRGRSCALFRGAAGAGEPCEAAPFGAETCGDGLRCDPSGVCAVDACLPWLPVGTAGDPCFDGTYGRRCADGLICDVRGSNCCRPPFEPGERCGTALLCVAGQTCFDETPEDTSDAVCVPLRQAGESCWINGCAEGLTCVTPAGAPLGACEPPRSEGSPCGTPFDCASQHCAEGTCRAVPGEGEPCTVACAEGLLCNYGVQPIVCGRPGVEQGPCRPGEPRCDGDLTCDPSWVCRPTAAVGEACEPPARPCSADGECQGGVCVARTPPICFL